jgi:hypothetical protein
MRHLLTVSRKDECGMFSESNMMGGADSSGMNDLGEPVSSSLSYLL